MSLVNQIDALQDAIKAALDARAATGGAPLNTAQGAGMSGQVPITLGQPALIQPEHVWITEATDAARIPETSGSTVPTFVGEFRQDVLVWVVLSGDDYTATRNRVTLLADDVEDQLDASSFAATTGLLDGWVEAVKRDTGIFSDARGAMVTLTFFARSYPT